MSVDDANIVLDRGLFLSPDVQGRVALLLEGEPGPLRVVDGVLRDDVGHAVELVAGRLERPLPRRDVVEEVLNSDLSTLAR